MTDEIVTCVRNKSTIGGVSVFILAVVKFKKKILVQQRI